METENERIAFLLTDGLLNAEQIGATIGITGQQVRNYWKAWVKQGLVELVEGTKTKHKKILS